MSGHSHFATIKRQKEAKDAQKGKIFSKLVRAISIAVKAGGGPDPDSNFKLRMAIDQARASNMPKENIERAITKASSEADNMEEVTYEGYGPFGVAVLVEVATDNRNRTAQEIKNIFERNGGSLGGPGSVSFNFESKGMIVVGVDESKKDDQMLTMIDSGVEDMNEVDDEVEAYTKPENTSQVKDVLTDKGLAVKSFSLVKIPKTPVRIEDKDKAQKLLSFLEKLEDNEDVQQVYANVDFPEDITE